MSTNIVIEINSCEEENSRYDSYIEKLLLRSFWTQHHSRTSDRKIIFHTTFVILFSQKNSNEEESGKLLIGQQRADEGEGRRGSVSFLEVDEIHGHAAEERRRL